MLSLEISPNSAAGCEKFLKQSDKRWVPQVFVHMVLEAIELCSGPPQSQINVLPDYIYSHQLRIFPKSFA